MDNNNNNLNAICSFCGRTQDEVEHLIAGNGVCICDDCIEICHSLIGNENYDFPADGKKKSRLEIKCPSATQTESENLGRRKMRQKKKKTNHLLHLHHRNTLHPTHLHTMDNNNNFRLRSSTHHHHIE